MVSAPETNWTSRQGDRRRPGRPGRGQSVLDEVAAPLAPGVHAHAEDGHLLVVSHGISPVIARRQGAPFPDQVLVVVVLVEVSVTSSTSVPMERSSTPTPGTTWPITTIFSAASSTAAMAEGDVGVGRPVGQRGLVAGVGVGPDLAPSAQGDLVELLALALGVATEVGLPGEGVGAAGAAAAAEEGGRSVGGEPAVDGRDRALGGGHRAKSNAPSDLVPGPIRVARGPSPEKDSCRGS
jgi:hypothetical protein